MTTDLAPGRASALPGSPRTILLILALLGELEPDFSAVIMTTFYLNSYTVFIETGFYYLQSRNYDPAVKRFLNADALASTGQGFTGYNMFAYCGNNPIFSADYYGQDAIVLYNSSGAGHIGIMFQDSIIC